MILAWFAHEYSTALLNSQGQNMLQVCVSAVISVFCISFSLKHIYAEVWLFDVV